MLLSGMFLDLHILLQDIAGSCSGATLPRWCVVSDKIMQRAQYLECIATMYKGNYVITYNVANLLGLIIIMGKSTKQITKQASAPRLQPANTNMRSHLLTIGNLS